MNTSVKKYKSKNYGGIIWQRMLLVFIALALGLSVYSVNARIAGEQLPMPLGYGTVIVLSGSMEPALSVDDLVIVRKCEAYAVGDVVVYQSENSMIIHRLIAIDGELAVTQGDANNTADTPFPMTAIKGKMVGKLSGVGRAVDMIGSPAGVTIALLAAAWLLALSYKKDRAASEAEMDELKEEIEKLKVGSANENETYEKKE